MGIPAKSERRNMGCFPTADICTEVYILLTNFLKCHSMSIAWTVPPTPIGDECHLSQLLKCSMFKFVIPALWFFPEAKHTFSQRVNNPVYTQKTFSSLVKEIDWALASVLIKWTKWVHRKQWFSNFLWHSLFQGEHFHAPPALRVQW